MPGSELKEHIDGVDVLEESGQEPIWFRRKRIDPAAALFITPDDLLYVRSVGAAAGVTLALRGRFQGANGEIIPFDFPHVPASNRTAAITKVQLGAGFLLSLCVDITAGAPRKGQVYVEVGLDRGGTTGTLPAETFFTGYPAQGFRLGWPPGGFAASVDGAGIMRSVQNAAPAAGAEFVAVVPAGARWELISLRATLTTAVAVANRIPHLLVDDGANNLFEVAGLEAQAASLTQAWVAAADGMSIGVQDTVHHLTLPTTLYLFQGWRIRSVTTALQAADQWNAQQLLVQEWLEL